MACIAGINAWLRGWMASSGSPPRRRCSDAQDRRSYPASVASDPARHWKRKRTIARKLIALGVKRESVWRQLYAGRKSWWALSHTRGRSGPTQRVLRQRGLIFLVDLHRNAPGRSSPPIRHNWRYGDDSRSTDRPAAGVITRRPEEPYTTSVRTVRRSRGAQPRRLRGDGRGALTAPPRGAAPRRA